MRIILIISIFIALNLSAQNLKEILQSLNTSSASKSLLQKSKSDITQTEIFGMNEAPVLGVSISQADSIPKGNKDGVEYSFGISQEMINPFSSSSRDRGVSQMAKAISQETKHDLHILQLNIVLAYHNTCVSQEMQEKSLGLYTEQSQRYEQFKKAYELGEISKKDLLFNKLELAKLRQNVSLYKREYLKELSSLQQGIDNINIMNLECTDLIEPSSEILLNSIEEHGELKVLMYKQNAAASFYKVHNAAISSIGYELLYEKELDTRRYTLGVRIPLDSLSKKKEKLRAEQFALRSSYVHESDSLKSEIQNYSKLSLAKLNVLYTQYELLKTEILPLNKELVILSKSALFEGEGNILEYLDSTRSYSFNLLEMLEIKKNYYTELFELYKIADIEYGEKICKN